MSPQYPRLEPKAQTKENPKMYWSKDGEDINTVVQAEEVLTPDFIHTIKSQNHMLSIICMKSAKFKEAVHIFIYIFSCLKYLPFLPQYISV